jgi:hypothetical protein
MHVKKAIGTVLCLSLAGCQGTVVTTEEGPNPSTTYPFQGIAPLPWVRVVPSERALQLKEVDFDRIAEQLRYDLNYDPHRKIFRNVRLVLVDYTILPHEASNEAATGAGATSTPGGAVSTPVATPAASTPAPAPTDNSAANQAAPAPAASAPAPSTPTPATPAPAPSTPAPTPSAPSTPTATPSTPAPSAPAPAPAATQTTPTPSAPSTPTATPSTPAPSTPAPADATATQTAPTPSTAAPGTTPAPSTPAPAVPPAPDTSAQAPATPPAPAAPPLPVSLAPVPASPAPQPSPNKVKINGVTYPTRYESRPTRYVLTVTFYECDPPAEPWREETIFMSTAKAPAQEGIRVMLHSLMEDLHSSYQSNPSLRKIQVSLD